MHYNTKPARIKAPYINRSAAGRASDFIRHAPEEIKPGVKVVLACRVSKRFQKFNGNLSDQQMDLKDRGKQFGAEVVGVILYTGSGFDPFWLARAVAIAKQHKAKILAESTDRLIRHPDYHSKTNPNAQARTIDLQDLQSWAEEITLVTVLHPDATPSEVRAYQRKRGMKMKNKKGGRPRNRIDSEQRALLDAIITLQKSLSNIGGKG